MAYYLSHGIRMRIEKWKFPKSSVLNDGRFCNDVTSLVWYITSLPPSPFSYFPFFIASLQPPFPNYHCYPFIDPQPKQESHPPSHKTTHAHAHATSFGFTPLVGYTRQRGGVGWGRMRMWRGGVVSGGHLVSWQWRFRCEEGGIGMLEKGLGRWRIWGKWMGMGCELWSVKLLCIMVVVVVGEEQVLRKQNACLYLSECKSY